MERRCAVESSDNRLEDKQMLINCITSSFLFDRYIVADFIWKVAKSGTSKPWGKEQSGILWGKFLEAAVNSPAFSSFNSRMYRFGREIRHPQKEIIYQMRKQKQEKLFYLLLNSFVHQFIVPFIQEFPKDLLATMWQTLWRHHGHKDWHKPLFSSLRNNS